MTAARSTDGDDCFYQMLLCNVHQGIVGKVGFIAFLPDYIYSMEGADSLSDDDSAIKKVVERLVNKESIEAVTSSRNKSNRNRSEPNKYQLPACLPSKNL